ncbi:hypothetical protein [Actinoplanes sp. NPDC051411]|uniref:ATP-dependent DNA ligase n=1 Tax=Actinoplanes sp. NPDC051411 TaxID=3155522 RepID=UPI003439C017
MGGPRSHCYTAGRRIIQEASQHRAHFVAFDLLRDADGRELLHEPLPERRRRLEQLFASAGLQLPICHQTRDRELAKTWFVDLTVAGVEGLVVKKTAGRYRPGRANGWLKVPSVGETSPGPSSSEPIVPARRPSPAFQPRIRTSWVRTSGTLVHESAERRPGR